MLRLNYPLLEEVPLLQGFGDNARVYSRYGLTAHNGLDLAVWTGTPVLAMASGVIRFAGHGADEIIMGPSAGECVLIDHGDYYTGYAHLLRAYGQPGEKVQAGAVIGLSGRTGATTGDHLHVELLPKPLELSNGYLGRIDPRPYFKRGTPLYARPVPHER